MSSWRAFVGDYDGRDSTNPYDYRSSVDVSGLSWAEARERLVAALAEDYPEERGDSLTEVCGHCATAAAAAREGLRDLAPETAGQWDVDWDTYALDPLSRSDVSVSEPPNDLDLSGPSEEAP